MVEAMLWERAGGTQEGWQDIMNKVEDKDFLPRSWPTALCSTDEASFVAVSLTRSGLYKRYINRLKGKVTVGKARESAERILARTQVYMPPEDMTLWTYFRTGENTLINKGSLAQKQASLEKARGLLEYASS